MAMHDQASGRETHGSSAAEGRVPETRRRTHPGAVNPHRVAAVAAEMRQPERGPYAVGPVPLVAATSRSRHWRNGPFEDAVRQGLRHARRRRIPRLTDSEQPLLDRRNRQRRARRARHDADVVDSASPHVSAPDGTHRVQSQRARAGREETSTVILAGL
jgi:hypothetical protein